MKGCLLRIIFIFVVFLISIIFITGGVLTRTAFCKELQNSENVLEKIFVFDSGERNQHLRYADELLLTSKNTAVRSEMLQLMYKALEEIIIGVSEVLPYDLDNEKALRLQRYVLDTGEKGLDELSEDDYVKYNKLLETSESGDCEATQKMAQKLLSSIPDLNYVRIVLGDCYFHNQDFKTALTHYKQAAQKDPEYARAYTRMAECYSHLGEEKTALSNYIQAVIINPGLDALTQSLKTYAYQHSYKVLLDSVPRMSRVIVTPEGELKVAMTTSDMPQASFNAWAAFGLNKYLLYREFIVQNPGKPLEPSFDIEKQALVTLLDIYEEMISEDPKIQDEDLDFLLQLRREGLLESYIYIRYFRPEFAESYFEWRKIHKKEIRKLFENYLVVVDPFQVKFYEGKRFFADSRFEDAFEIFRECAERFIDSKDPEIKKLLAECLTYMGRSARILGRTQEALSLHKAARGFMREVGYQEGEAKVLNSLSLTLTVLGRLDEALESYQESLAISRKRKDKESEISVLTNMGEFYLTRGEVNNASLILQEALKESLKSGIESGLGTIYTNLGCVASDQGDYKHAMALYEKGLHFARAQNDISLETTVLSNIGTLLMGTGQIFEAKTYLENAISLAQKLHNKKTEATILGNLGRLAYEMGDIQTSQDYHLAAYRINMEIKNRYGEAMSLLNLGGLSSEYNDSPTAQKYWNEALAIGRELKTRDIEATALHNIATVLEDEEESLRLLQDALNLFSSKALIPSKDNLYPTPTGEELLINDDCVRILLSNRGLLLYQVAKGFRESGDITREKEYLHYAYESLSLAIALTEVMRKGIEKESAKILFLAGRLYPYQDIIQVSLRLDELEKGKGWSEKAFHYSESSKSRALVDLLNESQVKRFAGIPEEELSREKEFELKMGALESSITKEPDTSRLKDLQMQMDELTDAYKEFKQSLKRRYPAYANVKYPEPIEIEEIQGILDDRTGFIEFFIGSDFMIYWVITKQKADMYQVSDPFHVYETIDQYRDMITDWRRALQADPALNLTSYKMGRELYTQLLSEGLRDLRNIKRLIIAPSGKLYYVPFQTFVMEIKNQKPHYLVEKYEISYVQSASVLASLKQSPMKDTYSEKLFAMGRPIYGWKEIAEKEIRPKKKEIIQLAKRGSAEDIITELGYYLGKEILVDLKLTEEEVDNIGEILENKEYIFKKEKATEDRVKAYSRNGLLKKFKYIHFAAHGLMSDEAPALCAVALTQDKDEVEDGFLTLGEVYGLELESDLVTLSACKLGLGRPVVGEGLIGLTRAFMYAGAPSVVVSMWSVADKATMMLMTRFYSNLNQGVNKDRAMQRAQLDLMKDSFTAESGTKYSLASPYFWAPFVLYGLAE